MRFLNLKMIKYLQDISSQAPILDFNALKKGDFNLGKVGIHGLKYKITTYLGQTQSNWDVFLEKLSSSAAESPSGSEPFVLQAAQVSIDTSIVWCLVDHFWYCFV